jgi:hypothetical protein
MRGSTIACGARTSKRPTARAAGRGGLREGDGWVWTLPGETATQTETPFASRYRGELGSRALFVLYTCSALLGHRHRGRST